MLSTTTHLPKRRSGDSSLRHVSKWLDAGPISRIKRHEEDKATIGSSNFDPTPLAPVGVHIVKRVDLCEKWKQNEADTDKLIDLFKLHPISATSRSLAREEKESKTSERLFKCPETEQIGQSRLLPDPTPVASFGIRVAKEVDTGEMWKHDEKSKGLFKWLFLPQNEKERDLTLLDTSCSSSIVRKRTANQPKRKQGKSKTTKKRKVKSKITLYAKVAGYVWNERLRELVQYRKQYGSCVVPNEWKVNRTLAVWVKRQRYQGKLKRNGQPSSLTDERYQALEDIGFVWSSHASSWDEKFHALQVFANRLGHCDVPARFTSHPQLSVWVRCQRRQYNIPSPELPLWKICEQKLELKSSFSSHLNPLAYDRFLKLKSIGFDFKPRRGKNESL